MLGALLLACLSGVTRRALAAAFDWIRPESAFAAKGEAALYAALGWSEAPREALAGLHLEVPEIAENGAVVPVSVRSELPETRRILLLVTDNPATLAAEFRFLAHARPEVHTRLKLAATSDIVAVVEAADGRWLARRRVKVTLGGCGG